MALERPGCPPVAPLRQSSRSSSAARLPGRTKRRSSLEVTILRSRARGFRTVRVTRSVCTVSAPAHEPDACARVSGASRRTVNPEGSAAQRTAGTYTERDDAARLPGTVSSPRLRSDSSRVPLASGAAPSHGTRRIRTPGFRLHPLRGDRAGQWSVRELRPTGASVVFRLSSGRRGRGRGPDRLPLTKGESMTHDMTLALRSRRRPTVEPASVPPTWAN